MYQGALKPNGVKPLETEKYVYFWFMESIWRGPKHLSLSEDSKKSVFWKNLKKYKT